MNCRQKSQFALLRTMGLLALATCQSLAYAQTGTQRAATIQLHVVPNGAEYDLIKTGRLVCNASKPEGCIRVPRGDTARITFTLAQLPGWHLTKVTICEQGDGDPCSLSPQQRADFEFTEDGSGEPVTPDRFGTVDLTALGADLQQFVLSDRNTVAQDYEYVIEACNGDNCTVADPPLENGGTR